MGKEVGLQALPPHASPWRGPARDLVREAKLLHLLLIASAEEDTRISGARNHPAGVVG